MTKIDSAADVDIDGGTGISIEADNNADASIVLKTNNATGVITLNSKDKRPSLGDTAGIDSYLMSILMVALASLRLTITLTLQSF